MKPEDLILPFARNEQRIVIHDRMWYVPKLKGHEQKNRSNDFHFPGWESAEFFENKNPVYVEYCSGNGSWIASKAVEYPNINWIAVEQKFYRARKIWSKIKNLNLKNLLVICGEGHWVTSQYFPSASISQVFINFPDPWPKSRHAKHRIVQTDFVEETYRILQPSGIFTLVTDDAPYSEWMIEIIGKMTSFESCYPDPFYVTDQSAYGSSYFDQLWREKGRIIRYLQFSKIDRAVASA